MLIKMTVKEMAALALALQERPGKFLSAVAQDVLKSMDEKLENYEKIVPPETESRNGFSVGDQVICEALDEWAGPKAVFTVTGFYNDDVAVENGSRCFVVCPEELRRIDIEISEISVDSVSSWKKVPWDAGN